MNRFPWYVEEQEQAAMAAVAPVELAKWRVERDYHKSLTTISAKQKHRKELERAYDGLKMAWEVANQSVMMAA
jgi:hypothetical protein